MHATQLDKGYKLMRVAQWAKRQKLMQSTQWAEGEKLTHASQYAEGYVETGSLDPNPIYASFTCSYSSQIIFTIFLLFLKVKDDLNVFKIMHLKKV